MTCFCKIFTYFLRKITSVIYETSLIEEDGVTGKSAGTVYITPEADELGLDTLLKESESSSLKLTGRAMWWRSFRRLPSKPPTTYMMFPNMTDRWKVRGFGSVPVVTTCVHFLFSIS